MKLPEPLAPLLSALRDLVSWFQTFKVEGLVIGGVAASLLGRPRVTHDVDALVLVQRKKWKDFLESGKTFGFLPRIPDPLNFAELNRVFLMRHEQSGLDIDISIGVLPFEEEAISRKIIVETGGVNIPLPTPEDLIIMKAVAHRPRDMVDIESILEVHTNIDQKYIIKKVREFSGVLEMPEILRDLKAILKRMSSNDLTAKCAKKTILAKENSPQRTLRPQRKKLKLLNLPQRIKSSQRIFKK